MLLLPRSTFSERNQRIKDTTDLLKLIPEHRRRPQREGARFYTEFCPRHQDAKTPNLVIYNSPGDQHAHCYACAWHFDVFGWVMWNRQCDFKEARAYLNNGHREAQTTRPRIALPREPEEPTVYSQKQIDTFVASMRESDYKFLDEFLHIPKGIALSEQIGTIGNKVYTFPSMDFRENGLYRAVMLYDPYGKLTTQHGPRKWRHFRTNEKGYIFRAPLIRGKSRVLIVEGGKDAERAVSDPFDPIDATSLTNGALSWQPHYAEFFEEADEIITALDYDASKIDPKTGCEVGSAGQRGNARIRHDIARAIPIDWQVASEMFGFELPPQFDYYDFKEQFPEPYYWDKLVSECRRRFA